MKKSTRFIVASAIALGVASATPISIISTNAYNSIDISEYFNTFKNVLFYAEEYQIEQSLESIYNTVAYIAIARNSDSGISDVYNYVLPITKVNEKSDEITYTCGTGSYVYTSDTSGNVSAVSSVTGTFTVKSNGVQIRDGTLWYFDTSKSKVCLYCDVPQYVKNSSDGSYRSVDYSAVSPAFTQFTKNISTGTIPNNTKAIKNAIPTPTQPYTTPAPGFPNLPDNWVNGDGSSYNIDFPDINIDIDLPSLPDYELPSAPTVPEAHKLAATSIISKCWSIISDNGLVWLVIFSLTLSVIAFILER